MGLTRDQSDQIADLLIDQINRKLSNYSPETTNMPFHVRLLGRDRMALFSFIQSINTTLGTSVFEQVAVIIAKPHFKHAVNQYKEFNNTISENAQLEIQRIVDELRDIRSKPNKNDEIAAILLVAKSGIIKKIKQPRIDLFLEAKDGTEYYFDLKTAKPNVDDIIGFKRKMLEWVAIRGAINPTPNIYTGLAIPYNPYEPKPYDRWTFQGMFDIPNEIKVAEEFWNFLGGNGTFDELLDVFEKVGIKLRPEIDKAFERFK
ncbi:MAG: TdeIII family type II restriction endonuclease [Armatimonadetes bacterium]|nr:TdeIII family type II restriction endonuclease [Armatimonadota bacterium]